MRPLLGTYVEIGAQGNSSQLEDAIAHAFMAMEEIQILLSFHQPDSDLSKLNAADCGQPVALHPVSLRVLRLAKAMTLRSQGLFNCTVGGFLVNHGALPNHQQKDFLDIGDADDIMVTRSYATRIRPVLVTLDGIAKGYAVDCAIAALKHHDCLSGWVNAGGDMRVFGEAILPIYRRELNGDQTPLGGLSNAAIATSATGNDQEIFPALLVANGKMPTAGTWSIIAHSAWRADALTKVACAAHPENRDTILEKLGGKLIQ